MMIFLSINLKSRVIKKKFCPLDFREGHHQWVVSMHVLLILPCNSGAKAGNYFLGRNWRMAHSKIKKQIPKHLFILDAGESPFFLGTDLDFAFYTCLEYFQTGKIPRSGIWRTLKTHVHYYKTRPHLQKAFIPSEYRFWEKVPIFLETGIKIVDSLPRSQSLTDYFGNT